MSILLMFKNTGGTWHEHLAHVERTRVEHGMSIFLVWKEHGRDVA